MDAAIGPLGASGAVQVVGVNGLYGFCGFVAIFLGGLILLRICQRLAIAAEERGNFQIVPQSSPIAIKMNPRSEPENAQVCFTRGLMTLIG